MFLTPGSIGCGCAGGGKIEFTFFTPAHHTLIYMLDINYVFEDLIALVVIDFEPNYSLSL